MRMLKSAAPVLALAAALALSGPAHAAGGGGTVPDHEFSFEGPFGSFDRGAVQRGFQVYREVCSGCHGLKFVSFQELVNPDGPAFTPDDIRALASEYVYQDDAPTLSPAMSGPDAPSDRFPEVLSAGAPDLSLMAKARPNGPDYIYALLTGYTDHQSSDGLHQNPAFPGGYLSMAQPLWGDDVEYADGTEATLEQQAEDVATFLAWVSEPHQTQRKRAGVRAIGFLILLAALLFFVNKKLWRPVKHPEAH